MTRRKILNFCYVPQQTQGNLPRTASRLVPLAHAYRQRAQRAGPMDVALLFGARCEYERLLAVVRKELGADRDELVDLMTRWSRCRGGSCWVT